MVNINRRNVDGWKSDVERSVDFYNQWFLKFAPSTYRAERKQAAKRVRKAFRVTSDGLDLSAAALDAMPEVLAILRQMMCPPIARERLAGLAGVSKTVVEHFEEGKKESRRCKWEPLLAVVRKLMDVDLLPWVAEGVSPTPSARQRPALVVADRLCGALSDPIIRNAQEVRQLAAIADFLTAKGYRFTEPTSFDEMRPGEFAYHLNIPVRHGAQDGGVVNIPVDVAILPKSA